MNSISNEQAITLEYLYGSSFQMFSTGRACAWTILYLNSYTSDLLFFFVIIDTETSRCICTGLNRKRITENFILLTQFARESADSWLEKLLSSAFKIDFTCNISFWNFSCNPIGWNLHEIWGWLADMRSYDIRCSTVIICWWKYYQFSLFEGS